MAIARENISKIEFQQMLIAQMKNQPCWRMGKYLGSMLTFDFGGKIPVTTKSGSDIELGTSTLGIRDCYWELHRNAAVIEDSDLVTDESARDMARHVENEIIEDVDFLDSAGRIELIFSNQTVLSVDITNKYKTEGAIIQFDFPNGQICEISPKGNITSRLRQN